MANNDITTKILDIQVRYKDAVDKLTSYRKAVADAQEEQKKLKKMLKEHEIQQEEYDRKMETSRLFIVQQNAAISTLTRQIQNQMKAEQESLGSLVQWRAELSLMTAEYDRMSQIERESAAGTELRDKISDLTLQIKEAEYGTQRFQRNVGNYPDVMAPAVVASAELTEILNKQAENAEEAQRQNEALKKALDELDVNAEGASDAIKAFNDKIEQNNQLIEENNRLLEESNQRSSDLLDSMSQLLGININLGKSLQSLSENNSGNFLDGLNLKAKALWKTLVGLVANPYILAVLGIAGVGMAFKWWYDYNKGVEEATRQTKELTGLGGNELKAYRNEVQAIADTFGKDFNEVLISANALSKKMGISAQEALVLIKDGFLAGGDANSRFLEVMKEYPAYFKEAGVSASQFVAITTQANKSGTVALKAIDSIKEANNRLRTMSSATSEALDALGLNSKKISKAIEDGTMSTFEAMQQVSGKLAELPANSQTVAEAVSNIFGSAGTDAGLQYLTTLKDIELNLDKVKDEAGEMAKLQEEQLKSQMELQNALSGLFDATAGTFESLTTKAKTFVNKGLTWVIKGVIDLCNWFIEFYNESVLVRGMVLAIGNSFKNTWAVIKAACGYIWDVIAGLGTMIKGAFTLNWDEFKSGWDRAAKALVKNMSSMVNEVIDNTVDAWNNLDKKLDKIEIPAEVAVDDSSIPTDDDQGANKKGGKKKDKTKKSGGKTPEEEEKELVRKAEDELYKIASDAFEARRKQIASEYDREIAMLRDKLERDKTLTAEQQVELNNQILALIQQKNDAILAAEKEILNGEMSVYEAKRLQTSIQYDRQIEDYKKKLETDKTLTEKSRQAINSIIISLEKQKEDALDKLAQEELKKEIEYRTKMIELQLAAIKAGSEEEFRLKQEQLLAQREMDLANTELTEEQRLAIIAKYNKMGEDLEKEHQLAVWTKQQEAMKTRFSNALDLQTGHDQERLAKMEMAGASETMLSLQQQYDKHEQERTLLAQMQEELATMRREDNETQTQFEERQAVKRQQIATQETQIKLTQYQLQKSTMSTLTSAIDAMGEHSKAFASVSKVIALAEISINTGKALAAGIAQAQSVPFPANLAAIATTVATILANVATAISTVKSAKFAGGGKVEGPGSGTSDSIPAMLSNGEYVINAESTAKYEPLLEAINKNRISMTPESDSGYLKDLEDALCSIIENERVTMRREESKRYERIINVLKESRAADSEYETQERIHQERLTEIERNYSGGIIVRRQNEIVERINALERGGSVSLDGISSIGEHDATDAASVYGKITRELTEEVAKAVDVSIQTGGKIGITRSSRIIAFAIEAGSVGIPGNLVTLAINDLSRKSVGAKALKFAGGGKVIGPGTSTSDSVRAFLSNGEYVVNAKATKLFEPLLMAMNGIGSQIPMQVANSYQTIESADMITNSFSEAAKEIKPVVSVVEITEAQDRVSMIENLDNY